MPNVLTPPPAVDMVAKNSIPISTGTLRISARPLRRCLPSSASALPRTWLASTRSSAFIHIRPATIMPKTPHTNTAVRQSSRLARNSTVAGATASPR